MKQLMSSENIEPGVMGQAAGDVVAIEDSVAAGAGGVAVKGNVAGNIVSGDYNFVVNNNFGTIVYKQAAPQARLRDIVSQPPRSPRGFVNRTTQLKQLSQRISAREAVIVYARDGMGKSALLRQTAGSEAARAMPHGVLFLEGIDESGQALGAEDVIQRLFDTLYESEPPLKVNFDTARSYLSNTQPLVVLNNLQLPVASLSRMADLFPSGALLIETNQPLESDIAEVIGLGPLPRAEAMELLVAKAGVTLEDAVRPALDSMCGLLADVPLAIVIAGRAIRENNLALEHAHDILASMDPPSTEATQRGIERAYALAYSTLSEVEREFLAAAALAPGISIDPEWFHHLQGNEKVVEEAKERLQRLGLLTANSPRLRIAPGLRDVARRGADESSVKDQLISYLKKMLETRSLDWNYCADELGNILGMIDWAAQQQRWSDVISLGRAIDPYLTLHGLWDAWHRVIERVLQSARQLGDRLNEAWAYHQLGTHAIGVVQLSQAIDFLRQALDLRSTLGDRVGLAYTQHNLDLLIPPTSPGRDNPKSPDQPGGNLFRLMIRIVAATTIALGLLQASKYVKAALSPVAASTATPPATLTHTPTLTSTPTFTPEPTKTPRPTRTPRPTEPPTLITVVGTTPVLACSPTLTGLQDANCRVGPSKEFEVYGTLFEGQTVNILAVNETGWLMVDHPQSFRNPCWVWKGPAVQVQGELGCVQMVSVPLPGERPPPPDPGDHPAPPPGENPPGPAPEPPVQLPIEVYQNLACYIELSQSGCDPIYWRLNPCSCAIPK